MSRGGGGQIAEEVSHAGELRLFDERGFEQTTIADIAEAADIAPRTFFGYFPSKEDVVFADFPAEFDALAERLRGRDEGESAIDALRAFIAEALERADLTDERELCRKRIMKESEALDAHRRALMGRMEDMLAEAVARDFGDRPGDLRPPMIASARRRRTRLARPDRDLGSSVPAHAGGGPRDDRPSPHLPPGWAGGPAAEIARRFPGPSGSRGLELSESERPPR